MGTYSTYTVSGPDMLPAEFKSFGFDSFDDFGGFGGGDFGGGGGGSYTIKTIRTTKGDGDPKVTRYSRGWRSTEQDHKIQTRVQKIEAQDFKGIRDECLEKGVLFEDPDFPANDKSVYYSTTMPQSFQWKRPTELVSDPRMFVGGASRFDVQQGDLGNCWFLASVASLCASGNRAVSNDLLYRVCPQDNSFVEKYAGVFRFRLWQYGKWVDVVIDDRLPTMNGRLMFMHSATENEFWSALLEKAYAKINGSYEALSGGCSSEAMEDLTGGVVETFNFTKEIPDNMWSILTKAHNRRSLMAAQIDCQSAALESVMENGLIIGHAYSITAIRQLHIRGHEVNLLRIRNPWGNQYEWKGSWSDQSREWSMVSESERQAMGLHFESDGEFWMSFEDFKSNFTKLEICNLSPDSLEGDELKKHTWEMTLNDGTWRANVNAGGCRNFLNTFWTNPQYRTEVVDPDEDDDENMGTIIVALMQKERRKKKSQGLDYLTIGFSIYALKDPKTGPLDLNFFKYNAAAKRSTFSNVREMSGRFKVPPGHYVIIPTTFKAGEEGDFLLRIFSEKPMKSEEIDEATGIMQQTDEKSIEDMEKGGVITGGDFFDSSFFEFSSRFKIDAKKRRLRSMQVTEDDVNQEKDARSIFRRTSGEDMEVDAFELRSILDSQFMKEFRFDGFGIETCRSMVALLDLDKSGKLGFEEFKKLWVGLRQWKKIFREFDDNNSGTLSAYQLRQALNSAGIQVSNMTFNALAMRYADKNGAIHFNDFIHCAVRIRTMLDTFIQMARGTPNASFDLDQFIQTTLYS